MVRVNPCHADVFTFVMNNMLTRFVQSIVTGAGIGVASSDPDLPRGNP
jgi:hypothetical protein